MLKKLPPATKPACDKAAQEATTKAAACARGKSGRRTALAQNVTQINRFIEKIMMQRKAPAASSARADEPPAPAA
jgi:hypothetical protein